MFLHVVGRRPRLAQRLLDCRLGLRLRRVVHLLDRLLVEKPGLQQLLPEQLDAVRLALDPQGAAGR